MAITVALALAIGLAITQVMPKRYVATATVLLDVKSPDPINGLLMQGMMAPSYMNTQIDLIGSETVARRVVRDLRLAESPELVAKWRVATKGNGDLEAWLAESIGKDLKVDPTRDTNLLRIDFDSPDPKFAAIVANAFAKAYIDTTLDLQVAPARQYKQFFDASAQQLRDNMEATQRKLSAYQQTNGLIGSDETLDVENARLNALMAQLVLMQSQVTESGSRLTQARTNSDSTQEALASPLIGSLRSDLHRDSATLSQLVASMGDNHPQVVELRASMADLQARIAEETKRVFAGVQASNSVNDQRLAELQASVNQQRDKVMRMKATRDQAMVLSRDAENAQHAYDSVLTRASQMGLQSQTGQTNASLVGSASVPFRPASPNLLRNIGSALFLGILCGLLIVMLRESRDPRIRTDEQAAALLRQPLITVVPRFRRRRLSLPFLSSSSAQRANRLIGG
jgi:chain length determinant protein EpsF